MDFQLLISSPIKSTVSYKLVLISFRTSRNAWQKPKIPSSNDLESVQIDFIVGPIINFELKFLICAEDIFGANSAQDLVSLGNGKVRGHLHLTTGSVCLSVWRLRRNQFEGTVLKEPKPAYERKM